ncbi:MAG: ABC transporter ATP-binding protein [Cellulosilyticaceae bacterium]
MLDYLKRYKGAIALIILLAACSVLLTLYIPIVIGEAIDGIIYDQVDLTVIATSLIKVAVMAALAAMMQWVMSRINNQVTYHVVRDVRNDLMAKIQRLPLKYLDAHPQGDIVSRVITDMDQMAEGLLIGFVTFFTALITIVGTLIFMLFLNWKMTFVVVLVTPLSLVVASFIAKRSHTMFKLQSEARGQQTALIDELLENIKLVKAYGYEERALERFDVIGGQLETYGLKATFFSSLSNPCTRFVNSIVYAGVALSGGFAVLGGGLSVGALTCFLSYANQYTKPFNEISSVVTELQNAIACAKRITDFLKTEEEIPEKVADVPYWQIKGDVALESVDFGYTPGHKLFDKLSLHVTSGSRVAIVGPTGCGKTTLVNLLMHFYELEGGQIIIDGRSLESIGKKRLREQIGMVLQDTWIKEGTIWENIKIGKPDATDEEVVAAAKAVHAHSFIKKLPDGYATKVSDRTGLLSQGQKQLLCIARIMLSKPPLLILDEATSSIDVRTELQIQKAFEKLMEGRTSFVVAHRLATIQSADLILVMKDGKIVEQGKHEQLLEQGGLYEEIYQSQFVS